MTSSELTERLNSLCRTLAGESIHLNQVMRSGLLGVALPTSSNKFTVLDALSLLQKKKEDLYVPIEGYKTEMKYFRCLCMMVIRPGSKFADWMEALK